MAQPARSLPLAGQQSQPSRSNSAEVLQEYATHELVFAVVGHVGSGTSTIAIMLEASLKKAGYDAYRLKSRTEILDWATRKGEALPDETKKDSLTYVRGPTGSR